MADEIEEDGANPDLDGLGENFGEDFETETDQDGEVDGEEQDGEGGEAAQEPPGGDADDDDAPPEWFEKMVETEGEAAALEYAEYLAAKQAPADAPPPQGAYDEADEAWNYQDRIENAQTQFRTLTGQVQTMSNEYDQCEVNVRALERRIANSEDLEDDFVRDLQANVDSQKQRMGELSRQYPAIQKQLADLNSDLKIAQIVENKAAIDPTVAKHKPIYAKLVREGKVVAGTSRSEVIGLIDAEIAARGGKGARKSAAAWSKVKEKLGKAPKKVGGGKAGGGGGKPKGGPDKYAGLSPNIAALMRQTDARAAALAKQRKAGK
jgi:hypothetical protein